MYIFLTILTILSFFVFQKITEKSSDKRYFIASSIPIFLYAITYGFRKGWATDYTVYDTLYTELEVGVSDINNYEILFRWLILFLRSFFSSSAALFVVIAIATMLSIIILFKDYRKVLGLALTIFYLFSAYQSANLARFFLALSLVYIGLYFALQKRWVIACAFAAIAFLIHAGIIGVIIFFIPILNFNWFLHRKANIVMYLIAMLLSMQFLQNLFGDVIYRFLSSINMGQLQLAKYADKDVINSYIVGSRWADEEIISTYNYVFTFLYDIIFIIYGYNLVRKMPNIPNIRTFYQIGAFGAMFYRIASNTEILNRIAISFTFLGCLVCAYMIIYWRKIKMPLIVYFLFLLSVAYKSFSAIKGLYEQFDVLYIWD